MSKNFKECKSKGENSFVLNIHFLRKCTAFEYKNIYIKLSQISYLESKYNEESRQHTLAVLSLGLGI